MPTLASRPCTEINQVAIPRCAACYRLNTGYWYDIEGHLVHLEEAKWAGGETVVWCLTNTTKRKRWHEHYNVILIKNASSQLISPLFCEAWSRKSLSTFIWRLPVAGSMGKNACPKKSAKQVRRLKALQTCRTSLILRIQETKCGEGDEISFI